MASLYELDQRMRIFENEGVDIETGEVATSEEDLLRMFNEIEMDLKSKMINMACYIKNLNSDIAQYDEEIKRLQQRKKVLVNKANRYTNLLDYVAKHQANNVDENFEQTNKWKIDDPKACISYRRSERLEITDAQSIPETFKTFETVEKIDTDAVKNAIKNGTEVQGAMIVKNLNLQIK